MSKAQRIEGFAFDPILDCIFVADYGQPDRSKGGIIIADAEVVGADQSFTRYRASEWRVGEVIAIGPGRYDPDGNRIEMPEVQLGDTVVFSRRHGTRLSGDVRYEHPKYGSLLVRVLDPEKTQFRVHDFEPWWSIADGQLDPSETMTG